MKAMRLLEYGGQLVFADWAHFQGGNCFSERCESIPTVLGCCSILSGGSRLPFRWKMAPLNLEKEERHKVQ
jgi:hypothetical protein